MLPEIGGQTLAWRPITDPFDLEFASPVETEGDVMKRDHPRARPSACVIRSKTYPAGAEKSSGGRRARNPGHCPHSHRSRYHLPELGPGYFDRRQAERTIRRCVRTLERLGHKVTLELLVPAA
jgi:hypothetical protein